MSRHKVRLLGEFDRAGGFRGSHRRWRKSCPWSQAMETARVRRIGETAKRHLNGPRSDRSCLFLNASGPQKRCFHHTLLKALGSVLRGPLALNMSNGVVRPQPRAEFCKYRRRLARLHVYGLTGITRYVPPEAGFLPDGASRHHQLMGGRMDQQGEFFAARPCV